MPGMYECQPFWDMCGQEKWYSAFPVICSDTGSIPAGEQGIMRV